MLQEVYRDALKNKDLKISKVKGPDYYKILSEASSRWIAYDPSPAKCNSAGVDSSWNKRAFQGLNLYVVDAVAVTSANKILASEYKYDISESARNETLESMAMAMEASVAQKAIQSRNNKGEYGAAADPSLDLVVCVDGSIIPRLQARSLDIASDMFKKYESAIFISKSSESKFQFGLMGSKAGDIYYYNHASKSKAGFSIPMQARSDYGRVFEIYARLRKDTPIIRIEVLYGDGGSNNGTSEQEVKKMLDRLSHHSVGGYPYCLKLAHDNCKVSNEDIDRLASIFSLQNEQGARDALNE